MTTIDDLLKRLAEVQEEIQLELDRRREGFRFVVEQKRIRFAEEVVAIQRRSKQGLFRYVFSASLATWLTIPVIYSVLVPMAILDVFLWFYQTLAFPVYKIPKVRRRDYIVLDRGDLPYLNVAERLNCAYCGYANGLASYFREITARTEQYWCPIKHSRRIIAAHEYYPNFFEFGDAESYRLGLERLRQQLAEIERHK